MAYTHKALQCAEEFQNGAQQAYALRLLTSHYRALKEYDAAIEYAQKTIRLSDSLNYFRGKSLALRELGIIAQAFENFEDAHEYFNRALEIAEFHSRNDRTLIMTNIALLHKSQKNYPHALELMKEVSDIRLSESRHYGYAWSMLHIGSLYRLMQDYPQAITYCKKAEPLMIEFDVLEGQRGVCNCLARSYRAIDNTQQGLEYAMCFIELNQELNTETTEDIARRWEFSQERLRDSLMQVQQTSTLESQITDREQQRNVFLLGTLAALLATAFLVMQLRYSRQKRISLEAEKEHEHAEAARLQELDRLKTDLYTNITHEFRTPLTVISGMTAELEDHPEKLSEISQIVQRNSAILLNLVNQMLDLSKVESGKLEVRMISGDVVEYVGYIIQSFQSMSATKDISLHVLNKEDSHVMDYDPDKLMQILSNLLSNSMKFTPGGGNIYVSSSFNGQFEIEVRDTGRGISEEDLPYIFDRFYRAGDQAYKSLAGTGIGLALTKQLVELMGGTIEASSINGKGTTFRIALPITRDSEELGIDFDPESVRQVASVYGAGSLAQNPVAANVPTLRVLPHLMVMEDNRDVRHFLATVLRNHYKLTFAFDGKQGVQMALDMIPDIIITDVMMPEKDGYQVCQDIKSSDRTNHIPIIMLTAKTDQESLLQGLRTGADAYLAKPFDKAELLLRLKKLLELRHTLHGRYTSGAPLEVAQDTKVQDEFIMRLQALIHSRMGEHGFGIETICNEMGMSRSHLHNKLKALTGRSLSLYVRLLRVQQGRHLVETTDLNVSEVAYDVGFSDPAYFSKCFSAEYGYSPSSLQGGT